MKFFLQFILTISLFVLGFVFYENYLVEKKTTEEKKLITKTIDLNLKNKQIEEREETNLIKNLNYNVELKESGNYEIKSLQSEIILGESGDEIVKMNKVTAIYTDKKNNKLYISSDNAEFNTNNYNTLFDGNINIKFEDNIITSDKLSFDFVENIILVYQNVIYTGSNGKLQTDNIKINLMTKNIELFMNDIGKNVKISSF